MQEHTRGLLGKGFAISPNITPLNRDPGEVFKTEAVTSRLRGVQERELLRDRARPDWIDSIGPVGCIDGWVEAGPSSHTVTILLDGDTTSREAIDAAMGDS